MVRLRGLRRRQIRGKRGILLDEENTLLIEERNGDVEDDLSEIRPRRRAAARSGGNDEAIAPQADVTITTVDELKAFATEVNSGNNFREKTVALVNNLDLANEEWTPIGITGKPFKGVFGGGNNDHYWRWRDFV